MAQAWRQMDAAAKAKYCQEDKDEDMSSTEDLSTAEKRKVIMRVAKRHQGDVSFKIILQGKCMCTTILPLQANMLQSLGCNVATMMFFDGQTVTVGTTDGKKFVLSHAAILSSFNSYFLYGKCEVEL